MASLGFRSFEVCGNLITVDFAGSLVASSSLADGAFYSCRRLEAVNFTESRVTSTIALQHAGQGAGRST